MLPHVLLLCHRPDCLPTYYGTSNVRGCGSKASMTDVTASSYRFILKFAVCRQASNGLTGMCETFRGKTNRSPQKQAQKQSPGSVTVPVDLSCGKAKQHRPLHSALAE